MAHMLKDYFSSVESLASILTWLYKFQMIF